MEMGELVWIRPWRDTKATKGKADSAAKEKAPSARRAKPPDAPPTPGGPSAGRVEYGPGCDMTLADFGDGLEEKILALVPPGEIPLVFITPRETWGIPQPDKVSVACGSVGLYT